MKKIDLWVKLFGIALCTNALTAISISDSLQNVIGSLPRTVSGLRSLRLPQNNKHILDFLLIGQKNRIETRGSDVELHYMKFEE